MNFALIGAAGFVAPRHMKAIKDIGGNLVAALDPHDSVGILDSYFPECRFFTEFERFDRHCDKLRRQGKGIDYVSICSPNYLHDSHIRWALRSGSDAICEKPLVLNERNLDGLSEIEQETGKRVWAVLQCRLHTAASDMAKKTTSFPAKVQVDYSTPRGNWYRQSWKGEEQKSGGIATNIGVHLFDLCAWLLGKMENAVAIKQSAGVMKGFLRLANGEVGWRLSVDMAESPSRIFRINGIDYDLTNGFSDLHTEVYRNIIDGKGFGIEDAREAIRICEAIRNA